MELYGREIRKLGQYNSAMNEENMSCVRLLTPSTLLGLLVVLLSVGHAQSPAREAMTATVFPEAASLVVGEPLQVNLTLRNNSSEVLVADLGADRKEAITMHIHLPDGVEKDGRILPHGGLSRIGKIRLQPGESYSQWIIVNDWFDISATGTYKISIELDNQVTLGSGATFNIGPVSMIATVLARSQEDLTKFCDDNLNRINTADSYIEALNAAEVLSNVHDPVAIPYLKKAFGNRYRLDALLVQDLEKIGTDDAIRTLVEVAEGGRTNDPTIVNAALQRLAGKTSDFSLRSRIREILNTRH
jgi:hypothetical protein